MRPPTIPGYRLLRYLGGGQLFQVWEARDLDDVIPIALKTPRPDASPSAVTLLRREARAGLAVRHRRVARVLRTHVYHAPYYVVSELLPGESVRDRLDRRGRLAVRDAVWVSRQVAEGLAALHRAGFIHADVKPDNVRVLRTGEAKLIDLGFTHRPGENRQLAEAGFVIGTAHYLAPELCTHPPREGPAADVFSLGVTLFEMLCGQLPYPAATTDEALDLRRNGPPLDLADVPGRWPGRVVELVRRCLARDPLDRPTAAAAARELARIEVEIIRRAGETRPSADSADQRRFKTRH